MSLLLAVFELRDHRGLDGDLKAEGDRRRTRSGRSAAHATAVHLVAAGVDITVIRSWLGHVSLDTTNHYAQANLDTKRKALECLEDTSRTPKPPLWKQDKSVLAWLDTL
jgi:integrase